MHKCTRTVLVEQKYSNLSHLESVVVPTRTMLRMRCACEHLQQNQRDKSNLRSADDQLPPVHGKCNLSAGEEGLGFLGITRVLSD